MCLINHTRSDCIIRIKLTFLLRSDKYQHVMVLLVIQNTQSCLNGFAVISTKYSGFCWYCSHVFLLLCISDTISSNIYICHRYIGFLPFLYCLCMYVTSLDHLEILTSCTLFIRMLEILVFMVLGEVTMFEFLCTLCIDVFNCLAFRVIMVTVLE